MAFEGCSEDMYRFFWELAFHNERAFFEENRERYERTVHRPMLALAEELLPLAREIDPECSERSPYLVSRIRRDTRFSRDKSPYRDYTWISFRPEGKPLGESFVLYADFGRNWYGYGMGCYDPRPEALSAMRQRISARSEEFLSLVNAPGFKERFLPEGEPYKRIKYRGEPEELTPYLNRKSLSFRFESEDLSRTLTPAITDEIRGAFAAMAPLYRFLKGLD